MKKFLSIISSGAIIITAIIIAFSCNKTANTDVKLNSDNINKIAKEYNLSIDTIDVNSVISSNIVYTENEQQGLYLIFLE